VSNHLRAAVTALRAVTVTVDRVVFNLLALTGVLGDNPPRRHPCPCCQFSAFVRGEASPADPTATPGPSPAAEGRP